MNPNISLCICKILITIGAVIGSPAVAQTQSLPLIIHCKVCDYSDTNIDTFDAQIQIRYKIGSQTREWPLNTQQSITATLYKESTSSVNYSGDINGIIYDAIELPQNIPTVHFEVSAMIIAKDKNGNIIHRLPSHVPFFIKKNAYLRALNQGIPAEITYYFSRTPRTKNSWSVGWLDGNQPAPNLSRATK